MIIAFTFIFYILSTIIHIFNWTENMNTNKPNLKYIKNL